MNTKLFKKQKRQARIRAKIKNISALPRLSVHRSNNYVYAQIIDDKDQKTLIGVAEAKEQKGTKSERARVLGQELAKQALAKKIKKVVFDKGSYSYHGRVKALAEGAREGGLEF
jgi:large subunit ribosomal protein L18